MAKESTSGRKLKWVLILLVFALFAAVFVVGSMFTEPPPPKKVRLATGGTGGAYFAYGKRFQQRLAELGLEVPRLVDYEVRIPPGGKTDALVETTIQWEGGLTTRGVSTDQLAAAIQATEHALNVVALHNAPQPRRAKRTRTTGRSNVRSVAR